MIEIAVVAIAVLNLVEVLLQLDIKAELQEIRTEIEYMISDADDR